MKKTNFREIKTENDTFIVAGRNDEGNDSLIAQAEKEEFVFHTKNPGSPFVNIKGKPKAGDMKFAALFCAIYSRDWKKNKSDVEIHFFKGKNIFKEKGMKAGTFGVKISKKIKLKKEEITKFEKSLKKYV